MYIKLLGTPQGLVWLAPVSSSPHPVSDHRSRRSGEAASGATGEAPPLLTAASRCDSIFAQRFYAKRHIHASV